MNKFIESCITDKTFNRNKMIDLSIESNCASMLLSFPRSANGWVRVVLSTFLSIVQDDLFDVEELSSLHSYPLDNSSGLKTAMLGIPGGKSIAIDNYIPDIYQYRKLKDLLSKNNDLTVDTPTKNIFKTHHLDFSNNEFSSYGIIIRSPDECVLSASLLLENDLMNHSDSEIRTSVEYYLDCYIKYFESYLNMSNSDNIYFISNTSPEIGLSKWISHKLYDGDMEEFEIKELLIKIMQVFPLKSGFDKKISSRININELPNYGRAQELYTTINNLKSY
jgi:hypothetical protein